MSTLNPFERVARMARTPATVAVPAAAVVQQRQRGKAPPALAGSRVQAPVDVMVMDRTGKRTVPLQPRPSGLHDIETSAAYRVSQEKRRAMRQASI